jgi:hypothetical protein
VVKLWEGGQVTVESAHTAKTPFEFWYNLAFKDCFPEVTHWWFRSAWTQRVRLTQLQGELVDGSLWGLMQFIDGQTPGHMYTITEADPPVIAVSYPPNEVQPVNLPLRLALSRLVVGIVTGEVVPGQWNIVTSLVQRDDLKDIFPTKTITGFWQLESIDSSLRQALCSLLGIKEE